MGGKSLVRGVGGERNGPRPPVLARSGDRTPTTANWKVTSDLANMGKAVPPFVARSGDRARITGVQMASVAQEALKRLKGVSRDLRNR